MPHVLNALLDLKLYVPVLSVLQDMSRLAQAI
jgi:hypothetical protein